jgi:hypothetical protein
MRKSAGEVLNFLERHPLGIATDSAPGAQASQ